MSAPVKSVLSEPLTSVDLIIVGLGRIAAKQGLPVTACDLSGRDARLWREGHASVANARGGKS